MPALPARVLTTPTPDRTNQPSKRNTRLAAAPGRQASVQGTRGPCASRFVAYASRFVAYASRFRKATAPAMMAITA